MENRRYGMTHPHIDSGKLKNHKKGIILYCSKPQDLQSKLACQPQPRASTSTITLEAAKNRKRQPPRKPRSQPLSSEGKVFGILCPAEAELLLPSLISAPWLGVWGLEILRHWDMTYEIIPKCAIHRRTFMQTSLPYQYLKPKWHLFCRLGSMCIHIYIYIYIISLNSNITISIQSH